VIRIQINCEDEKSTAIVVLLKLVSCCSTLGSDFDANQIKSSFSVEFGEDGKIKELSFDCPDISPTQFRVLQSLQDGKCRVYLPGTLPPFSAFRFGPATFEDCREWIANNCRFSCCKI
jgi:hypothetical protein